MATIIQLSAVLSIILGVLILLFPKFLRVVVGIYFIAAGLLALFL
nr:DUF3096 domain-containing protein [Candidatus Woesearchaeota archaeon]